MKDQLSAVRRMTANRLVNSNLQCHSAKYQPRDIDTVKKQMSVTVPYIQHNQETKHGISISNR